MTDVRRALPAVHRLLDDPAFAPLIAEKSRTRVTDALRTVLDRAREQPNSAPGEATAWAALVEIELRSGEQPSMRRIINATGIVLHTNLGRAPLPRAAVDAIQAIAGGYADIEFDLASGKRGTRNVHSRDLLAALTGAEDAMVVNNCASALLLALRALAHGRDVLVSRGELIEIGGSFRIPDIMAQGDVRLIEIGTTNRTHLDDYRRALTPGTGAIVKVHRSNFTMDGFVREVSARDLSTIAAEAGIPLIHDLGSGLMIDLAPWGLGGEPTAASAIADGADVVVMSGDKLLGGPQAGIVIGKREWISRMRSHPLARAVRIDKLTMAALDATLGLYRDAETAAREIPTLSMITSGVSEVRERATSIAASLRESGITCDIVESEGAVGGGSFPTAKLPSFSVRLTGNARRWDEALRSADIPIVGRISDGAFLLDVRTVQPSEVSMLIESVRVSHVV
jgi:L-seryl-tRNA(Ser) seleniumtransferase